MKISFTIICTLPFASGFLVPKGQSIGVTLHATALDDSVDRRDFVKAASIASFGIVGIVEPAFATGRATLDQSYERYAPRIKAGGEFYQGDFKQMVAKGDWAAIKLATGGVPPRKKEDLSVSLFDSSLDSSGMNWLFSLRLKMALLQKADAGVAARARKAGEFSEDRVLVAGMSVFLFQYKELL